MLQVNQGQVLAGGQQIMVHAVPQAQQTIQLATQNGQGLQQLQVVPISALQVNKPRWLFLRRGANLPYDIFYFYYFYVEGRLGVSCYAFCHYWFNATCYIALSV